MTRHEGLWASICGALMLVGMAHPGCTTGTSSCGTGYATPIVVTVVHATSEEFVCDAQVTASNGSSTYRSDEQPALDASVSSTPCIYLIDAEKPGTYSITASAPGLHMVSSPPSVTLMFGPCGYEGSNNDVTIEMSP